MDPQLPVDAGQVNLNRLDAQEEPGTDIAVRQPVGDEQRDLELLRSQLLGGRRGAPTKMFPAGAQLGPGSLESAVVAVVPLECVELKRLARPNAVPPIMPVFRDRKSALGPSALSRRLESRSRPRPPPSPPTS
jgi:hypothetical protein